MLLLYGDKMEQGFVKYFVIIGAILATAFFSQQVNLLERGNTFTFVNGVLGKAREYMAVGTNWVADKAFPNISGEVQKRGEMVSQGVSEQINEQKEKVSESISEKIKNYFSGITDAVLHPGEKENKENNNCDCQTQPAQTPSSSQ